MASFFIKAINQFDSVSIKQIRGALGGEVIESNPQELQVKYAPDSFGIVFQFGCAAFFNVSPERIETELERLKAVVGPGLPGPTNDTYSVELGEATKVEFEYTALKKISMDHVRLVMLAISQSVALEYFELIADRLLDQTARFLTDLSKRGVLPVVTKDLMKIIGSTASTRQHVLSKVAILDPPDEAWKSKELEKLHYELQQNFDLETRFKTFDRKLSLIQDNIEILTDLAATRKAAFLESLIVLLIVVELILAVVRH